MTTTTWAGTAGRIAGTAGSQIDWAEVGAIVLHGLQVLIVLTLLAGRAARRAWDALPVLSEQLGRAYARLLVGPAPKPVALPAPPQISAPIVTRHQLETMTCRQLMALTGTRRKLAKRQLVELALAAA